MAKQVKCNKCGHIAPEEKFPKGHDFFQNSYIASCPKCDNRQNPADASMRMFGGGRPFVFVDRSSEPQPKTAEMAEVVTVVRHRAEEAS